MQNSCIQFHFCVAVKEGAFEMVITVYVQCAREISKNTTSQFSKTSVMNKMLAEGQNKFKLKGSICH